MQVLATTLLGGSWVVISRVISRITLLIIHIRRLITLLITTDEPPSRAGNGTASCSKNNSKNRTVIATANATLVGSHSLCRRAHDNNRLSCNGSPSCSAPLFKSRIHV